MTINFFSSKDSEKTCTMYRKKYNTKIKMDNETDKIIEDLFDSFLKRCQEKLENSMQGSGFLFNSVDLCWFIVL